MEKLRQNGSAPAEVLSKNSCGEEQWFPTFLHQGQPQQILSGYGNIIMTNVKMNQKTRQALYYEEDENENVTSL